MANKPTIAASIYGGLDQGFMLYWSDRVRLDALAIMSKHSAWEKNRAMIRNSIDDGGYRKGNIVSEFVRVLNSRLLDTDFEISINSDDPSYTERADDAEVVARSLARICNLKGEMKKTVSSATWAPFGVLEFGHPLDQWDNDPWMTFRTPGFGKETINNDDRWEEVSAEEVKMFGGDVEPDDVPGMSEVEPVEKPIPVFNPTFGYPWVKSLDPRYMIFPLNAIDPGELPYVARVRFITRAELIAVQNFDADRFINNYGTHRELFEKLEGDGDMKNFAEMCVVIDLWIRRDRNNPQFNNYYISYLWDHPEVVIRHGKNPYGGMSRYQFMKLTTAKNLVDITLAEELTPYADIFDSGIQAIERMINDLRNRKDLVDNSAGLNEEEEKKYCDPNYKGIVKVVNSQGVKRVETPEFNPDLLKALIFMKSLAQANVNQSDIDRGQAIKDITARQTQALLDSTGINVKAMAGEVSKTAMESVMKLAHLAGIYSMLGRSRKFQFGNRLTELDRGSHDFITSYIYDVKIKDSAEQETGEDRMLWVQFLRLIISDTNGLLMPNYDGKELAAETLKIFNRSPRLLQRTMPAGFNPNQPAIPGVVPGQSAGQNSALQDGSSMVDMLQGQHPERGARGLDLGNLMRGQNKIGS